ncbi:DUF4157 domain-containing protein [Streptomyces sp. NPDC059785]|uniref:eCIS core domain-containing protein n=1 Tax=Streptomyces sp. NPDC059785 TaxID=3346945 RepID=UPI003646E8FE
MVSEVWRLRRPARKFGLFLCPSGRGRHRVVRRTEHVRKAPDRSENDITSLSGGGRVAPGAGRTPTGSPSSAAEIALVQRFAGDRGAQAHVHGAGCGHPGDADTEPVGGQALLQSALASPDRPLPGPLRAEAESFYQNDFSAARVHDGPVAQRAAAALGARVHDGRHTCPAGRGGGRQQGGDGP